MSHLLSLPPSLVLVSDDHHSWASQPMRRDSVFLHHSPPLVSPTPKLHRKSLLEGPHGGQGANKQPFLPDRHTVVGLWVGLLMPLHIEEG